MDENESIAKAKNCMEEAKEWCDNIMNESTTLSSTAFDGTISNADGFLPYRNTTAAGDFLPYWDTTADIDGFDKKWFLLEQNTLPSYENYIDFSNLKIFHAYGLYITLNDDIDNFSKSINNCDATNKTEVAVNWMGVERTFKYSEFLKLLGFDVKEKEDVSAEIKRGLDYIFNNDI